MTERRTTNEEQLTEAHRLIDEAIRILNSLPVKQLVEHFPEDQRAAMTGTIATMTSHMMGRILEGTMWLGNIRGMVAQDSVPEAAED